MKQLEIRGEGLLVYPSELALVLAKAENRRLTKTLDLACAKLADQFETIAKLNKMLDCACDELRRHKKMNDE